MAFSLTGFLKGLRIQKEDDRTKQLTFEVGTATTNTTTAVVAGQTANRTLTLPDATDTLVGKATNDIFTNKTLDADGSGNSITNIENADIKAGAGIDAAKLADGSVSNTEFQFINSVTSNVQTQLNSNSTAISDHIADSSDAHAASAISNTPAGTIGATTVQAAINELDGDNTTIANALSAHIADPTGAHTASAITNVPSGNLTSTDVQGALDELQTEIDGIVPASGANISLSNLNNPTSINRALLPSGNNTLALGNSSLQWSASNALTNISTRSGGASILNTTANLDAAYVGAPTDATGVSLFNLAGDKALYLETAPNTVNDATPTNQIILRTGNKTTGTGNSGNLTVRTGTSAGGTRGKIKFTDGTEGTAAAQWRSTDSSGSGAWVSPNYQVSSNVVFTTTSGSPVDVTGLTVTITTTGRPVVIKLIGGNEIDASHIGCTRSSGSDAHVYFYVVRDATTIDWVQVGNSGTKQILAPSEISHFDTPAAGTYTYKIQAAVLTINTTAIANEVRLVAYEI